MPTPPSCNVFLGRMPTHYHTPSKMKGKPCFFSSSLTVMCGMITIQNPDLEEKKRSPRPPLAAPKARSMFSHASRWLTTCKLTQKQAEKFGGFFQRTRHVSSGPQLTGWCQVGSRLPRRIRRENKRCRCRFMKEVGMIC